MKLCIAEKPSVAGEIAKVVGATSRLNGFYEGNGYCVTWVFGHLCELKEPHDYNVNWKRWYFNDLPLLPSKFSIKLKNDSGVKRQFDIIKNLVGKAEEVINCGDAGQEGELIQRWVLQLAGLSVPMKRLWISSLTEEAIREGFQNLRAGSDFDNLYAAGSARAIGDWLLGMNATRAYTLKYARNSQVLSIGRVQTPTLALIVKRDYEIRNFKPETYLELKTKYRGVVFSSTLGRLATDEAAQAKLETIKDKPFVVTDFSVKEGNEAPLRLFDLTALQVECNKKFAFSADETLKTIQLLYEKKLTTYPRVDTTYLSDDIYPKVPQILRGLLPYAQLTQPLLASKIKKSKKVFDNSKVTDHHAIIPTGVPPSSSLSRNEKLVYDAVARRFIANFYPDSKVSTTTVNGKSEDIPFKCVGKQIIDPGWRNVYGTNRFAEGKPDDDNAAEQDEDVIMPSFEKGESGSHEPFLQKKQTQPPKQYTEATLLRAMETAGKQVDDEELRDLMKDNGIGRPSTRAAIIETLFKRKYIVKERKNLIPTITGIQLIGVIRNDLLKSVELTGLWERKLRLIEKGGYSTADFMTEMRTMVTEVVQTVGGDMSGTRVDAVVVEEKKKPVKSTAAPKVSDTDLFQCPRCGKPILKGKSAWGCSGFREGCSLIVPFEYMGKRFTDAQIKSLFAKGETTVIKGLSVDGKSIDGRVAFDAGYQLFVKPVEAKSVSLSDVKCPFCGGAVIEGRAAWGCSNFRAGCRFMVPFVFMEKRLTLTHLSVLARKRATGVISGFTGADGQKTKGKLVIDDSGAISLEE